MDRAVRGALAESASARGRTASWSRVPEERHAAKAGVISPLMANLFLHYTFDRWMAKRYLELTFERFADDAIVHCRTEAEAQEVRVAAIAARLQECGLELHPEKTKRLSIARMKTGEGRIQTRSLIFSAIAFRPRRSKNREGKYFINFSPAVSDTAVRTMRSENSKLEPALTQ